MAQVIGTANKRIPLDALSTVKPGYRAAYLPLYACSADASAAMAGCAKA
jgi:hypothetical protein